MGNQGKIQEEKELKAMSGYLMLFVGILGLILGGGLLLYGIMRLSATGGGAGAGDSGQPDPGDRDRGRRDDYSVRRLDVRPDRLGRPADSAYCADAVREQQ